MSTTTYTPEIAAAICERLAAGESLRAICRDEGMPSEAAVRGWVVDDRGGFAARYTRARNIALDTMADDMLDIADTLPGTLDNGATDGGAVAHSRLRVDARKWYLAKLAPKRYGDKQDINLTGEVDVAATIITARKRSGGG